MAGPGMARQGKVRTLLELVVVPRFVGAARHGGARRGAARLGTAWFFVSKLLQENLNYDFSDRHNRIEAR